MSEQPRTRYRVNYTETPRPDHMHDRNPHTIEIDVAGTGHIEAELADAVAARRYGSTRHASRVRIENVTVLDAAHHLAATADPDAYAPPEQPDTLPGAWS